MSPLKSSTKYQYVHMWGKIPSCWAKNSWQRWNNYWGVCSFQSSDGAGALGIPTSQSRETPLNEHRIYWQLQGDSILIVVLNCPRLKAAIDAPLRAYKETTEGSMGSTVTVELPDRTKSSSLLGNSVLNNIKYVNIWHPPKIKTWRWGKIQAICRRKIT